MSKSYKQFCFEYTKLYKIYAGKNLNISSILVKNLLVLFMSVYVYSHINIYLFVCVHVSVYI